MPEPDQPLHVTMAFLNTAGLTIHLFKNYNTKNFASLSEKGKRSSHFMQPKACLFGEQVWPIFYLGGNFSVSAITVQVQFCKNYLNWKNNLSDLKSEFSSTRCNEEGQDGGLLIQYYLTYLSKAHSRFSPNLTLKLPLSIESWAITGLSEGSDLGGN